MGACTGTGPKQSRSDPLGQHTKDSQTDNKGYYSDNIKKKDSNDKSQEVEI